jgi:hypothetical protein
MDPLGAWRRAGWSLTAASFECGIQSDAPHWRGWLGPENRCLVPVSSFAEYAPEPNPETKMKDVVWFANNEDRPRFAFAGIWTEFKGDRGTKSKPVPGPRMALTRRIEGRRDGDVATCGLTRQSDQRATSQVYHDIEEIGNCQVGHEPISVFG